MKNEVVKYLPSNLPDEQYDQYGFAEFSIIIFNNKYKTSQKYYMHNCNKIEYQEIVNNINDIIDTSEKNPQTIYFLNDDEESEEINPTLQVNSKRKIIGEIEPRSENPTTLYFINEEESES